MENKIKVAICDDVVELCNYFKNYFDIYDDIEFVGMSHNTKDFVELVRKTKPDILLLDIQVETFSAGIDVIPELKKVSPESKIIMLTVHNEPKNIFEAMSCGANDYIVKSLPFEQVLEKVYQVYQGLNFHGPEITSALLEYGEEISARNMSLLYCLDIMTRMSKSEYEILLDLYNGLTYKEISEKRFVEESTVRSQVSRFLRKFDNISIKQLIADLRNSGVMEIIGRFYSEK